MRDAEAHYRLADMYSKGDGVEKDRRKGMTLDFIDIRRAYFHSKARREVYVQLPEEDYT